MLANNGIIFFDLHFLSHGALVLVSSVVMTSTGAGYEFDLVTWHDALL